MQKQTPLPSKTPHQAQRGTVNSYQTFNEQSQVYQSGFTRETAATEDINICIYVWISYDHCWSSCMVMVCLLLVYVCVCIKNK